MKCLAVTLRHDLPPARVHLILQRHSSDTISEMIALAELKSTIAKPLGISRSTFYRALQVLPPKKRKEGPTTLLTPLKDAGALPVKTSSFELVSLGSAAKLLKAARVPKLVVESLLAKVEAAVPSDSSDTSDCGDTRDTSDTIDCCDTSDSKDHRDIRDNRDTRDTRDTSATVVTSDTSDSGDSGVSGDTTSDISDTKDVMETDVQEIESRDVGARYGLNSIKNKRERQACLANIMVQMQQFQQWSMAIYQPGRPTDLKQQSSGTFESQRQRVHEYLGYLYHYKEVTRPTLNDYLNTSYFSNFREFLTKRGLDKAGHTKVGESGDTLVTLW